MQKNTFFQRLTHVAGFAGFATQAPIYGPSGPQLVIKDNFPDPSFIERNGAYFAFSTQNGKANVPVAFSQDFQSWELTALDAMPDMPAWASGDFWAPDVTKIVSGKYGHKHVDPDINRARTRSCYISPPPIKQLGSTASELQHRIHPSKTSRRSLHHSLVLTSKAVRSPQHHTLADFVGRLGGAIDPAGFTDTDGSHWVVYKVDGNSLGGGGLCGNADGSNPTPIMLQQLDNDGVTPVGAPIAILDRSAADGPLIEAPSLAKSSEGVYFLSFSSNCYNGPLYDISYATSTSLQGPFTKSPEALLLPSDQYLSPGGATLSQDLTHIMFHTDEKYSDPSVRPTWVSPLSATGTTLRLTPAVSHDTTSTS